MLVENIIFRHDVPDLTKVISWDGVHYISIRLILTSVMSDLVFGTRQLGNSFQIVRHFPGLFLVKAGHGSHSF